MGKVAETVTDSSQQRVYVAFAALQLCSFLEQRFRIRRSMCMVEERKASP